jgi:hypothetical protein
VRYRFKGIVRTTGQTVEGHAHGNTPEEAYQALSDHGIVTESLREEPEQLNLAGPGGTAQPLTSAIDSALDIAASQVPFDKVAERYKGKSVWVIDRDKIRTRVTQVVDQALRDAIGDNGGKLGAADGADIRKQVADAIGGLFKDNRNLTSEVSNSSLKLEHAIKRLESMVHRQESLLAQMTIAISRIGSGGGGGGGWGGPRRFAGQGAGGSEQNAVLLEIFKENLRLRGIEIDEPKPDQAAPANGAAAAPPNHEPATASVAPPSSSSSSPDSSESKGDQ